VSPEQRRWKAEDAKALLDNPIFKSVFKAAGDYVEAKALSCDPDNKDAAQRVILTKQLLAAVEREIRRHIDDGAVAEFQIAELEKRKLLNIFRR